MVVDRYAQDGVESRRTVRDRYDLPVPKDEDGTGMGAVLLPRSEARTKARARARR